MACQTKIPLLASSTITASGTSTAVVLPAYYNCWVGFVSVGTITGTTPTLDITIQHSSDGTNWVSLIAFAQLVSGSASTTTHKFAAAATDYLIPLLPYCRISYTIGGSATPTFNSLAVTLLLDKC
jgi:hypothetical protein